VAEAAQLGVPAAWNAVGCFAHGPRGEPAVVLECHGQAGGLYSLEPVQVAAVLEPGKIGPVLAEPPGVGPRFGGFDQADGGLDRVVVLELGHGMQRQQQVGDVEAGRGRVKGAGEVDGGAGSCHRVGRRRAGPGQEHEPPDHRLLGSRREQHRLDCLGPGQERAGVAPPGQVLFPGLGEACRGILAYRLMEAEPGPRPARVRLQQRRGDELVNQHVNLAGHPEGPRPPASSASEATRRRLATSSSASGRPPALRQMLPASTSSPGPARNVTPAMEARARNSVTASVATGSPASPGRAMGCTRHTHSGSMSSGMRLVTRIRRSVARPASCSQAPRADSSTCSQLSITSSDRRPDTVSATASSPAAASAPLIPTASTRAATT
jgi:hypothetical protein